MRQKKLNVPIYTFKKKKAQQKHFCNISVTLWNNFSFCQFQSLQRPCQNQIPETTSPIVWDIMGEHAQGTQHLLRPSGSYLTVESQAVKPHCKAPRDFPKYETPMGVNNLVCWLGREQKVVICEALWSHVLLWVTVFKNIYLHLNSTTPMVLIVSFAICVSSAAQTMQATK